MQNRKKARKRSGRNARRGNLLAVLFLFLLPPLGVILLWRSSWSDTVKYCVTGAVVLTVSVGVALLPSAENRTVGGIELIGREQEVEVYGPSLPTAMVAGYTVSATGSVFADVEEKDEHIVYAAKDGECYHEYDCKFAYASSQHLTLYEAYCLGYKPCGRCNPPEYVPAF